MYHLSYFLTSILHWYVNTAYDDRFLNFKYVTDISVAKGWGLTVSMAAPITLWRFQLCSFQAATSPQLLLQWMWPTSSCPQLSVIHFHCSCVAGDSRCHGKLSKQLAVLLGMHDREGKPRVCEWMAKWLINLPVAVTAVSQLWACLVC